MRPGYYWVSVDREGFVKTPQVAFYCGGFEWFMEGFDCTFTVADVKVLSGRLTLKNAPPKDDNGQEQDAEEHREADSPAADGH